MAVPELEMLKQEVNTIVGGSSRSQRGLLMHEMDRDRAGGSSTLMAAGVGWMLSQGVVSILSVVSTVAAGRWLVNVSGLQAVVVVG